MVIRALWEAFCEEARFHMLLLPIHLIDDIVVFSHLKDPSDKEGTTDTRARARPSKRI